MKQALILLTFLFIGFQSFGADFTINSAQGWSGIGVGTIIAIVASWSRNKSVLWALWHAFCGWFYVIYYVITR